MKVSVTDFKNALSLFEAKVITSQDTTMNKFVMGIALSRLNANTDDMIKPFLTRDGMVDVGKLRADIDDGMKATGGDELDVVPDIDPKLRLFGVTIKNIKFTKDDFKDFFDNIIPSVSPSAIG
jgi:hypothetical protein